MSDGAGLISAARHAQNASGGNITLKVFSTRTEVTLTSAPRACNSTLSDGSLSPIFHLSQAMEGGTTYPSRTPWPPATSGCRKSWLWWSHNARSSWWRGRWRSVSPPCHLPHLPSSTALQLELRSASGIPHDSKWHSARRNQAQQGGKRIPPLEPKGGGEIKLWQRPWLLRAHDGSKKTSSSSLTWAPSFRFLCRDLNPDNAAQFMNSGDFLHSLTFQFSCSPKMTEPPRLRGGRSTQPTPRNGRSLNDRRCSSPSCLSFFFL